MHAINMLPTNQTKGLLVYHLQLATPRGVSCAAAPCIFLLVGQHSVEMSVSSHALSSGASSPDASSAPSSDPPSAAVSSAIRGFGHTNTDTYCLSCGKSVGRRGQIHMRKQMADHFSSSEQCRPPGKLNYSALARDAELKMIANDDRFRRLGKGGCDWFERDDPADIFKCVSCDHLFDSFGKAARHHVRTSCQNGPPPAPVSCHITSSGVLVEVRPMYRRRLESSLDAAAGSTCKYCLFALILCNSILFLSPGTCIFLPSLLQLPSQLA